MEGKSHIEVSRNRQRVKSYSDKIIKEILNCTQEIPQYILSSNLILLCGSVARNESNSKSDLDLIIIGSSSNSIGQFISNSINANSHIELYTYSDFESFVDDVSFSYFELNKLLESVALNNSFFNNEYEELKSRLGKDTNLLISNLLFHLTYLHHYKYKHKGIKEPLKYSKGGKRDLVLVRTIENILRSLNTNFGVSHSLKSVFSSNDYRLFLEVKQRILLQNNEFNEIATPNVMVNSFNKISYKQYDQSAILYQEKLSTLINKLIQKLSELIKSYPSAKKHFDSESLFYKQVRNQTIDSPFAHKKLNWGHCTSFVIFQNIDHSVYVDILTKHKGNSKLKYPLFLMNKKYAKNKGADIKIFKSLKYTENNNSYETGFLVGPINLTATQNHEDTSDFKSIYLNKVFAGVQQNPISKYVIHLNESSNISEDKSKITVRYKHLLSYLIPGIYVSSADIVNTHLRLSECTLDIIGDRHKMGKAYDTGLVFRVNTEESIYIDRKRNIPFLNLLINEQLKRYKNEYNLFPRKKDILLHACALENLINELKKGFSFEILIEDYFKNNDFSIVGSICFELIHEYLTQNGLTITQVNSLLKEIDPSQTKLWSLRAFKILDYKFTQNLLGKYGIHDFDVRMKSDLLGYLSLYLNDNLSKLWDCSFNTMFSKQFYEIEKIDKRLDPYKLVLSENEAKKVISILPQQLIENTKIKNGLSVTNLNLILPNDIPYLIALLNSSKNNVANALKQIINKGILYEIRKNSSAVSMALIKENTKSFIVRPFQPDNRGELIVIPDLYEEVISKVSLIFQQQNDNISCKEFRVINNYSEIICDVL